MEFFPSQSPAINFFQEDTLGQFEWNPMAGDSSVNPEAPRDISDNFIQSILTPEEVSAFLAACDSGSPVDPFSTEYTAESLSQALWNMPQYPDPTIQYPDPAIQCPESTIQCLDATFQCPDATLQCPDLPLQFPDATIISTQDHTPTLHLPLEPINTSSTTYRNGFGDPIHPVDYHPYDFPTSWEANSTASTVASSIHSPCDSYPTYSYPVPQLGPEMSDPSAYGLMAGSSYPPCQSSPSSNVSSIGKFSEKPVKRHRCQICGRAFQRQTTLTQHQITHTGERPYACPVSGCDKAFTTASNAKRHAKIHFRTSHAFHRSSLSPGPY